MKTFFLQITMLYFVSIQSIAWANDSIQKKMADFSKFIPDITIEKACNEFKTKLSSSKGFTQGTLLVPIDYNSPVSDLNQMKIFYWIKKGANPSATPVLLIHGGPGGNSQGYFNLITTPGSLGSIYPGDIISFDIRNEGCSNVSGFNLPPQDYFVFRNESVVQDINALHNKLYPNLKWRVFGQSRGSSISHLYLQNYPNSIESISIHSLPMMKKENHLRYTFYRGQSNALASAKFVEFFPAAGNTLQRIQQLIQDDESFCVGINLNQANLPASRRIKACGKNLIDAFSFKLSNYTRWKDLAASINGLVLANGQLDQEKVRMTLEKEFNGTVYARFFNYILGTNGQDYASPNHKMMHEIENDPNLKDALISEGRYLSQFLFPAFSSLGFQAIPANIQSFSFNKVKKWLKQYEVKNSKTFSLVLFRSKYDALALPRLFDDEISIFNKYINLIDLNNSGHEGWSTEQEVSKHIFRFESN